MSIFVPTHNFNRGEVSDSVYDSGDSDIQASGCKRLNNWFVDIVGAAARRPGFEFIALGEAASVSDHMVYVEFRGFEIMLLFTVAPGTLNVTVEYINLNNTSDRGVLAELLTEGDPFVDFSLSQILTYSQFGPSVFFASELFPPQRLFFPINAITGQVDSPQWEEITWYEEIFGLTTATSGSNAWEGQDTIYQSQLESGDIIRFRGELYEVDTVTDDENFTTTTNYEGFNITDTLAVQRDTGEQTFVSNVDTPQGFAVQLEASGSGGFLTALSVGDYISVQGQIRQVTNVVDDDTVEIDGTMFFSGDPPQSSLYRLGSTPFTLHNPKLVSVIQGRLVYANSTDKPTGVWASIPNDPFVLFGSGTNAASPINVELIADGLDEILWMTAQDRLYLGGDVGEYSIGSPDQPITPSNFGVRKIGATGNSRVPAVAVGSDIFHINPNRDQLYFTRFDELLQNFQSDDLSSLSPHLLEGGVTNLVYQNSSQADRTPRFWVRTTQGSIATVALAPRNNVIAWTPLTLGGPHPVVQVTASPTDTYLLARDQDNDGRYYLLRLGTPALPYALDFTHTFESPVPLAQVPPPFWGYTVMACSQNKGVLGDIEVSPIGQLDLAEFGYPVEELGRVTIGFYFKATMELLSAQNSDGFKGSLLNRKRRLIRTIVSVYRTDQLMVNGIPLLGSTGNTVGSDISPQTGKFPVRTLGWANEDAVVVETASVYPAKVLSIVREIGS